MSTSRPTIALAIGDPNGIGPEIAVKAAAALDDSQLRTVLVGDAFIVRHYAAQAARDFAVREIAAGDAPVARTIDVLPVGAMPREATVLAKPFHLRALVDEIERMLAA